MTDLPRVLSEVGLSRGVDREQLEVPHTTPTLRHYLTVDVVTGSHRELCVCVEHSGA